MVCFLAAALAAAACLLTVFWAPPFSDLLGFEGSYSTHVLFTGPGICHGSFSCPPTFPSSPSPASVALGFLVQSSPGIRALGHQNSQSSH
ncbi:hypothetical protein KC349_g120 [Hortaea werneckii]|nr:hypothetical protein KC349_g120 [Hortaea werneckii]